MRLDEARKRYAQGAGLDEAPAEAAPEGPQGKFSRETISAKIKALRARQAALGAGSTANELQSARRLADKLARDHGLGPNGELPPEPDASDRALIALAGKLARHFEAYVPGTPKLAKDVTFLGMVDGSIKAQSAYDSAVGPMQMALALHTLSVSGTGDVPARQESFAEGFAERIWGKAQEADDARFRPAMVFKGFDDDWRAGFEAAEEVTVRLALDEDGPETRMSVWL